MLYRINYNIILKVFVQLTDKSINKAKRRGKDMKLELRQHQAPIYKELNSILNDSDTVCLALDTGSGKTEIACKFVLDNPEQRVVVFAHNQLVLKKNFSERLTKYGIKHTTNIKDYISGAANVLVTLPASVANHLDTMPNADTIIIDESHEYYKDSETKGKKMYTKILEWHKGTKILLTASHFEINDVPKVYFSREESLNVGQVADIKTRLVSNELVELKQTDFNKNGDIKETVKFEFSAHPLSIIEPHLEKNSKGGHIPTMVITPNTGTAIEIYKEMLKIGYSVGIDLSKKGYDKAGLSLLKGGYIDICIVVNKGILGFDYADLATVIDCSFTQNVQRMIQSKRSGRKSDTYPNKQYIKLAPDSQFEHYRLLTVAAVAVGEYNMYREWDGQTKTVRIPAQYEEDEIIVAGRLLKKVEINDTISIQNDGVEVYTVTEPTEDMSNKDIIDHLVESGQVVRTASGTKRIGISKPLVVSQEFELMFTPLLPILADNQTTLGAAFNQIKQMNGEDVRLTRTYEECKEIASKHKSLAEWERMDRASYRYAGARGWRRQIAKELNWSTKSIEVHLKRTYEECKEIASKYKSLAEWTKVDPTSYMYALRKGWHRQVAKELNWSVQAKVNRTYEECKEIASKYKSLAEWYKMDNASYQYAYLKGWLRTIAKELGWSIQEQGKGGIHKRSNGWRAQITHKGKLYSRTSKDKNVCEKWLEEKRKEFNK